MSALCAGGARAGLLVISSRQLFLPHLEDALVADEGHTDERPLEGVENDVGIPEELDAREGSYEAEDPGETHNGRQLSGRDQ